MTNSDELEASYITHLPGAAKGKEHGIAGSNPVSTNSTPLTI
jgi:hypothetical protein